MEHHKPSRDARPSPPQTQRQSLCPRETQEGRIFCANSRRNGEAKCGKVKGKHPRSNVSSPLNFFPGVSFGVGLGSVLLFHRVIYFECKRRETKRAIRTGGADEIKGEAGSARTVPEDKERATPAS